MPPYLPLEIVDKIHSEVEDRRALARWCPVARRFLDDSRERLYRRLDLRLYANDVNGAKSYFYTPTTLSLLNTLVRNEDLAELVEEVGVVEEKTYDQRTWLGISADPEKVLYDALMLCDNVTSITLLPDQEKAGTSALWNAQDARCEAGCPEHDLDALDLQRPTRETMEIVQYYGQLKHLRFSATEDDEYLDEDAFTVTRLDYLKLESLVFGQLDDRSLHLLDELPRSSMAFLNRLEIPFLPDDLAMPLSPPPSLQHLTISSLTQETQINYFLDNLHTFPSLRSLSVSAGSHRRHRSSSWDQVGLPAAVVSSFLARLPAVLPPSLETLALLNLPDEQGCWHWYSTTFAVGHFRTLLASSLPPGLRLLTYDRRHIPPTLPLVDWEADNRRHEMKRWMQLEDECKERGIWCRGLRAGPAEWDPYCERPPLLL
ncbi:hypothetical protein JCM8097_002210 [Rhodosporidiobolus ruineniae]